jgi:hypothetical protein
MEPWRFNMEYGAVEAHPEAVEGFICNILGSWIWIRI